MVIFVRLPKYYLSVCIYTYIYIIHIYILYIHIYIIYINYIYINYIYIYINYILYIYYIYIYTCDFSQPNLCKLQKTLGILFVKNPTELSFYQYPTSVLGSF